MKKNCVKRIAAILLSTVLFSISIAYGQSTNSATNTSTQQQAEDLSRPVTKGEFSKIINTYMGLAPKEGANFNDVSANDTYAQDLLCAKESGYFKGDADGNVNQNKSISGPEASVAIQTFLGFDLSKVSVDQSLDMPNWAKPAASNLIDLTIITKALAEKKQLTVEDANQFGKGIAIAKLFSDSPYALKQASLQEDFFANENRQYLATATVQEGYGSAGTFTDVYLQVDGQLEALVKGIINNPDATPNSDQWKANQIYQMYMDNEARTKSFDKLKPMLNDIKNVSTLAGLTEVRNKYSEMNLVKNQLLSMTPLSDSKVDARKWSVIFSYPSVGLPTPDYYADNANMAPIQEAYKKDIMAKLTYMEETENLQARADAYFNLEKSMAEKEMPLAQQADYPSLFAPTTWDAMNQATANIDKDLKSSNQALTDKVHTMNVYCPDMAYIQFADTLYTEKNLSVLKDMAMLQVINSFGYALDNNFKKIDTDFYSVLYGVNTQLPDEKMAQNLATSLMGNAFSKMYAEQYSSPKLKADVTELIEKIREKRIERINQLDWMSPETKAAAVDKLKAIKAYVAYPDTYEPDMPFDIVPQKDGGTLVDIGLQLYKATADETLKKLNKPANENVWSSMKSYTVNAQYNPFSNAIVIPTGILHAPFYDLNSNEAANLGGIGAVIGHEFTHAFDSNGAKFDKNGTISNWWTESDYAAFQKLVDAVAADVSNIELQPGMKVNGALCTAETIADLGGLSCSLAIAKDENLDLKDVMETWAKVWVTRMSLQMTNMYLSTDVHGPNIVRVNYTLSQQDDFYKAYSVQAGDKMYVAPKKRIVIW